MRILFLTLKTFSATGGIEQFNRCFSKALWENGSGQGWDVTILSAYDGMPDERYFPATHFKGFGGNKWRFFLSAIASMRQSDIVFFGHINLAPLMRICQWLFPKTLTIGIAHGREVWEPLSQTQLKALQHCQRVWAVSRFTAGKLALKNIAPANTDIFYNTLDPYFNPGSHPQMVEQLRQRYGIVPGQKVVITVARLAETEGKKGYDLVLQALPQVMQQFPNLVYLLCGKWQENEKKRITNLINALKLHNVVLLTGFIPADELNAHYALADVFVLPSRKEGFGIVFLEAASCGLPVIGGNQDGASEALLEGKLGLLVDPTDTGAISRAIQAALSDPKTPEQKTSLHQMVEAHFGFAIFKNQQLKLLEEVRHAHSRAAGIPD